MAITLTDEMLDLLQKMDGPLAKAFLQGIQMAQNQALAALAALPAPPLAPQQAPPLAPQAPSPSAPSRRPIANLSAYAHNRGAQAEVLRALFTGPASYTQLQEALRFDRRVIVRVLSQCQRQGDVVAIRSSTGQDVWQLTPQGRHVAAVFVNNPGLKILNTQVRQRLTAADKLGKHGG